MTDDEFREKINDAKSIAVIGHCCTGYNYAGMNSEAGPVSFEYRTICPCPVPTQICVSESSTKILSGISDGSRYYGQKVITGYTTGSISGTDAVTTNPPERGWGSSVTASADGLEKTITATCNYTRDENGVRVSPLSGAIQESTSGTVSVAGEHLFCIDLSEEYEVDSLHQVFVYEIDGDLDWNGGSSASATVGKFKFYDFVTDGCSSEPSEYSYTNTHHTDGQPFSVSVVINDNNLEEEYSQCPSWCDSEDSEGNVIDPQLGTECVSYEPCGACVTSSSHPSVNEVDVKYAVLWTNLRCGENYRGSYNIQKRDYLAFCPDVDDEDNWFHHEGEQFAFVADKPEGWFLEGGNLNVEECDFYNAGFSTSIYDYRAYFFLGYDEDENEVWDTDKTVVSPTRSLPKERGEQYRVDPDGMSIWQESGSCPTVDDALLCPEGVACD